MSGALSAAIFNPTDVLKIRFQVAFLLFQIDEKGDPSLKQQPRRYKSLRAAIRHIVQHEGILGGLYKGVWTTMLRSAVLSATQLASYDTFKHQVLLNSFSQYFPEDNFKGKKEEREKLNSKFIFAPRFSRE